MKKIMTRLAALTLLCVLAMIVVAPGASAASYSKVYGETLDRVRVRASASTSATIIDNIVKGGCVYVTSSKTSGSTVFVEVKYRNSDGDTSAGWICQSSGSSKYIEILSAKQAESKFGVKDGALPSKRVGTFTASQRKSGSGSGSGGASSDTVKDVQTKLKALGYYSAEITGNVGAKTETAIKKFQKDNGLTADGVIGPKTQGKLDAVYAAKGGSSSSGGSSGGAIKLGSSGSDVTKLQQDLKELGFYAAEITGNVGAKTEAAIKAFQKKHNLSADGVAGPDTLAAISAALRGTTTSTGSTTILRKGSQGSRVSQLQQDLKTLGFYSAEITGNIGSKTEAAIMAFQRKNGLTADGIAGPDTLDAIAAKVGKSSGSSSSSGSGLHLESTGSAVSALQQNLTTLGYYYGDITGHYGSMTEAAVRKFQKARGLTADGVAGSTTLDAIASALRANGSTVAGGSTSSGGASLREGDSGTAVTELQNMLKKVLKSNGKPYYYGEVTGHYGTLTRQAVRKFQDDHNLTVDGIAGTRTLNLLRQLTGSSASAGDNSSSGTVTTTDKSYGRIIKDNVYLRSSYSTTSAPKASLAQGTLVRISRTVASGDSRWYYISVTVGNYVYKGYVRSDMMETLTADQYAQAGGDGNTGAGDQETLGIIRVTGSSVKLRYAPNTDATVVGYASKGDTFYYVDVSGGWYQTRNGYWISGDYVEVLSGSDADQYIDTDTKSSYRLNDTGSMVTYIQQALQYLEYYKNEVTGHFGAQTEAAVKRFQRDEGIAADGVVGPDTLARLRALYSGESSAQTEYKDVAYNINWFTYKESVFNKLGLKRGNGKNGEIKLTDLKTGRSFNIYVQSTGNHADVEPATAKDTTTMCEIFGVSDPNNISYVRRPAVLTVGGYQFACAIYGQPHGSQDITSNNFPGQFCLHFLHSKTHGTNQEYSLNVNAVSDAVKLLKDKKVNVLETPPAL